MTAVLRLTLVSHAMTDAMAAGRFPVDEPLSETGRQQITRLEVKPGAHTSTGPERRARQTAELLGLPATEDPRLADLDYGRWRGQELDNIDPEQLRVWLTDPAASPHGGESIVDLVERVNGWLAALDGDTVAVTHPAVIRAAILLALDAPPNAFWRIDIAPAGRTVLHYRGQSWTLRL